jgi:thiosulfate dehydrogenase [quinone] large subunit
MEIHNKLRPARLLFHDTRSGWLWLALRVYLGYEWIGAGWAKVTSPEWVGLEAGGMLTKFLTASLAKTAGAHPDVASWYAWLITHVALPHTALFSNLVAVGEVAVGVALIVGLATGLAAGAGAFMNFNYLLAGTVSINPQMLVLQVALALAWRVAGYFGLDGYLASRRARGAHPRTDKAA